MLSQVLAVPTAKIIDADALRLLTPEDGPRQDWILTPHPGEAAQLLGRASAEIQADLFMDPEESKAYGLIDQVIAKRA